MPNDFQIQQWIFRAERDRLIRATRVDRGVTDFYSGVLDLAGVFFQPMRAAVSEVKWVWRGGAFAKF